MYYHTACLTQNALSTAPGEGEGILIRGENAVFRLSPQMHTHFTGATGSGKTTAMKSFVGPILRQIHETGNGTAVIFDPKGDFRSSFAREGDVILNSGAHWNILREMQSGFDRQTPFSDIFERAVQLSDLLFAPRLKPGASSESYFPQAASSVLAGLLSVMTMEALEDPDLAASMDNAALLREINLATPDRLKSRMMPYESLSSIQYHLSTSSDGTSTSEGNGVLSELTLCIRRTFVGSYAKSGSFSILEFLSHPEGRVVFLPFDYSMHQSQSNCARGILDLALQHSLSAENNVQNIWFVLEELPLISDPTLINLSSVLNMGRSSGIHLLCATQSVSQLYHLYGREQAESILGGFGQSLFFRPNDAAGAEYIQHRFGNARFAEYGFSSHGERTRTVRSAPAVESWQINSLQIGEAIVSLPGLAPFPFHFLPQ